MSDPASPGVVLEIATESGLWDDFPEADPLARTAIDAALRTARADLRPGAEISLLLCDDAFIRELNARFRGKDRPTNVLSFPSGDDPASALMLGDIAIAFETFAREAEAEGKSRRAHFSHLVIHGLLHLLGHDHENDREAEAMERLERESLAAIGIADPYLDLLEKGEAMSGALSEIP